MSFSKTIVFLLVICTCFIGHDAWDRIATWGFRSIFLYANQTEVWKLTFKVNHQDTALQAMNVVSDWIPKYWKTKDAYLNKNNKLSNQTYAEQQAWEFLQQRDAMRKFLRFMFRSTIDTKYFTEDQAIRVFFSHLDLEINIKCFQMRDIWWKSDRDAQSNFTRGRPLFKNRTMTEFAKTHKDFGTKFEKLTDDYYYYHYSSAEKLNWTLVAEY
ncbi:hypothetical protein CRE_07880 [Caenorhabditis remanei]|uniref:Uncharacterized protein n=1 Tax=Caenorhabditis remanei TaxID=31234 RepID=E3NL50_CAERE|nr:hypothetical protein CRE_07880 [Caenorhabditis remanei]